jgi:hypothetical protein
MLKILSNFQMEWCTFAIKKRTFEKNKDCLLLRFECFEYAKTFFICVKLWACKLCNLWNILIFFWQFKTLCFIFYLSNIQKCSFKECPLTWVVHLCFYPMGKLTRDNTSINLQTKKLMLELTKSIMDLKIEGKLRNLLWIYLQLGSILEYSLTKTKIKKIC